MIRPLTSPDEIVAALGGAAEFRGRFSLSPQQLTNARARGRLPANLVLVVNQALREVGHEADPQVFGVRVPVKPRRPKQRRESSR